MTLKTHTIEKKGEKRTQIWEWEETPELIAAVEQLQKSSQVVKDVAYKPRPIHTGNKNFAQLKKKDK